MQKTVLEAPQQNGVAERMNQTLNDRAKSMRLDAGLPKMLWAYSVNTVAYLTNRGSSVPIGFNIPEEEWKGQEISLKHLKVFICVQYVKVKESERDKLNKKARNCTFIGYKLDDIGYRLWDNQNKKVIRIQDVMFNESSLYKDELAKSSSSEKQAEKKE